ncbi:hypothetical protein PHLCEN_2v3855 [Hermanssonia centrifuga]|uniref:Uncharacterized protein n=1 Tax=Hermanssonia centrifuga TaxID=98765 RepID=A0A2R6QBB9_9APHY|nr:hypothetical protein PHLCEN_2v3855 [Hermanssonia centrifuga]
MYEAKSLITYGIFYILTTAISLHQFCRCGRKGSRQHKYQLDFEYYHDLSAN